MASWTGTNTADPTLAPWPCVSHPAPTITDNNKVAASGLPRSLYVLLNNSSSESQDSVLDAFTDEYLDSLASLSTDYLSACTRPETTGTTALPSNSHDDSNTLDYMACHLQPVDKLPLSSDELEGLESMLLCKNNKLKNGLPAKNDKYLQESTQELEGSVDMSVVKEEPPEAEDGVDGSSSWQVRQEGEAVILCEEPRKVPSVAETNYKVPNASIQMPATDHPVVSASIQNQNSQDSSLIANSVISTTNGSNFYLPPPLFMLTGSSDKVYSIPCPLHSGDAKQAEMNNLDAPRLKDSGNNTGDSPVPEMIQCKACNAAFHQISQLRRHLIVTHAKEKPFKCNQCSRTFVSKTNLNRHKNCHNGIRTFKCGQCESAFYNSTDLKGHIRTHTGEKPYKCQECPKAFAWSTNLTRHRRTHIRKKLLPGLCKDAQLPVRGGESIPINSLPLPSMCELNLPLQATEQTNGSLN